MKHVKVYERQDFDEHEIFNEFEEKIDEVKDLFDTYQIREHEVFQEIKEKYGEDAAIFLYEKYMSL